MPIAMAMPGSPQAARRPSPSGMQRTNPTSASGTSARRRARDEHERERDREADPRDHPRREIDDEMPEVAADLRPCTRSPSTNWTMRPPTSANTPAAAPTSDRLTHAACTTCRPAASGSRPRRVSGADEIRPSENAVARDERRRGEIRVREARHAADAELRGEAQREQVAPLERERHRRALEEIPEARQHIRALRCGPSERALAQERNDRNGERDRGVDGEPPGERDEPVTVCERGEDDEPRDAAEREAASCRAVAVDRCERARRERREQLAERRRHEHLERAAGDVRRAGGRLPGDQVAELAREDRDEHRHGNRKREERNARRRGSRPPSRPSAAARVRSGTTTMRKACAARTSTR